MQAFLLITSFSLAFYLGLLFFLYRDGRKHRPTGESVYKVKSGYASELGPLPSMRYGESSLHRKNRATVPVRFAVNSLGSKLKSQMVQSEPAKVLTLPTLTRDSKDAQCG